MRMSVIFVVFSFAVAYCYSEEGNEPMTGVHMEVEIAGSPQGGGTVTIGKTGGGENQVITVNTLVGDTVASIAAKISQASRPNNPDAAFKVKVGDPANIILVSGQVAGGIYFRTTDTGIETVPMVSNLQAVASKEQQKVVLSWNVPITPVTNIVIYRNASPIADLSGNSTSYTDADFTHTFGDSRYSVVCGAHPNAEGTPLRFSDVTKVDADNPRYMQDDIFRVEDVTAPVAALNKDYKLVLYKNGGTNPVTWSILSGSLPPGLAISTSGSEGLITGKPTAVGTFAFIVRVTDATGATTTKELSITIQEYPMLSKVENE